MKKICLLTIILFFCFSVANAKNKDRMCNIETQGNIMRWHKQWVTQIPWFYFGKFYLYKNYLYGKNFRIKIASGKIELRPAKDASKIHGQHSLQRRDEKIIILPIFDKLKGTYIASLKSESNKILWKYHVSRNLINLNFITANDSVVFVVNLNNAAPKNSLYYIKSLNISDGKSKWSIKVDAEISGMFFKRPYLYVGIGTTLLTIDANTGSVVSHYFFKDEGVINVCPIFVSKNTMMVWGSSGDPNIRDKIFCLQ